MISRRYGWRSSPRRLGRATGTAAAARGAGFSAAGTRRRTAEARATHAARAIAESRTRLVTPARRTMIGTAKEPAMRATTSPEPMKPNSRFAWRTS